MIKEDPSLRAITHVVDNMRELDRIEITATLAEDYFLRHLPAYIETNAVRCWAATWHHETVAIFGVTLLWPGVGQLFCFGTDNWGRGLYSMTKFLKKNIYSEMQGLGLHRAECKAQTHRGDVYSWLTGLGAEVEGTLFQYGKDRSDFQIYAWTLPDENQAKN